MTDQEFTLVAKALAHPARVRIIRLLAEQTECKGHEVFATLPLAQSTVSQHLSVLKEAGLLVASPVGTAMVYCLAPDVLEEFLESLQGMMRSIKACTVTTGD